MRALSFHFQTFTYSSQRFRSLPAKGIVYSSFWKSDVEPMSCQFFFCFPWASPDKNEYYEELLRVIDYVQ